MDAEEEQIIGLIPVIARLGIGSETLRVILTDKRIIIAHLGKRGIGRLASMPILGKLALGVESIVVGEKGPSKKRKTETPSPQETLDSHKDNFQLDYEDIVTVGVDGSFGRPRIMLLTKDNKYEFSAFADLDSVVNLFQQKLAEKLEVTR